MSTASEYRRRSPGGQGGWLHSLALVSLTAAVVALSVGRFSFDDPRPLYNAWTYLAAIPTGILVLGLLTRRVASQWLETGLQAAFLISLAVHLLALQGAFHLIVLSSSRATRPELTPTDLSSANSARDQADAYSSVSYEPNYKDPTENIGSAMTRSQLIEAQAAPQSLQPTLPTPTQGPDETLRPRPVELDADPALSAARIERAASRAAEAQIRSQARVLTRDLPVVGESPQELAATVEVPQPLEVSTDPAPQPLSPAPRYLVPQPRSSGSQLPAADLSLASPSAGLFERRDLQLSPPALGRLPQAASQADLSRAADALERMQQGYAASRAAPQPLPRASIDEEPLSPGDLLLGGLTADVPPADAAPAATSPVPSDDVANLGFDRREGSPLRGLPPRGNTQNASNLPLASATATDLPQAGLPGPNLSGVGPRSTELLAPRSTELAPRSAALGTAAVKPPSLGEASLRLPQEIGRVGSSPIRRGSMSASPPQATAVPTAAFAKRGQRNDPTSGESDLGQWGPQTETAIESGLAFLARNQQPDGSWTLAGFGDRPTLASDTAATGLSLLAFQGAGYSHLEYQYQDQCRRAIDYLIERQRPDGDLYIPMDAASDASTRFYSHAIAALALCEAFGMTQDERLREPAQRSIDYLAKTQDAQLGGWRYQPGRGTDTSVTGWCMMALKSAELAGLRVDRSIYRGIEKFLNEAAAGPESQHLYRYNPHAPDQQLRRHGLRPTTTMTSVGLLLRFYLGWRRDNPQMIRGAEYLLLSPPAVGTPADPQRDTYYWYYATQVFFHMGGDYWRQWHSRLHPMLIESQVATGPMSGSWQPGGPIPDRWGGFAGRLYVTTMNLLSLEVYYRHLPLYEETAR